MLNNFSKILNYIATIVIVAIIGVLIYSFYISFKNSENKTLLNKPINFTLNEIHLKRMDSTLISTNKKFIEEFNQKMDSLKIQIKELNEIKIKMEDEEKRNGDYFRLVFALVGSVFAIVGFFGFKSIHETRENAVKIALTEAQTIAKTVATAEAKETINTRYQELFIQIDILKGNYEDLKNSLEDIELLEDLTSQLKIRIDDIENTIKLNGERDNPQPEVTSTIIPEAATTTSDFEAEKEENKSEFNDNDEFADK